ncbi:MULTISPECIES: GntR family transcriptional regulator [Pseudomonas]|jgi:DNA-binding GntR family transcriptional regulator|uniref:DNA-binding transcriptional regulator, GntR family n=1 Tax=Pseudomonas extremorientalis TaxID=169669 RepID=A0A1H0K1H6_9PSED|nr:MULTISPECIES: GntR family transcriptional regulator [Pseudomonas]KAB0519511.1 GntR family transcriptional regulator [Pseudomonas extremorientalis]OIN13643.1 GntR family transcriptional regulator [Pseudomonas extremorientalis]QZP18524.1 GntR family transcriptional regulator [Pseudomonas sp. DR208]UUN86292.1 GntR family transcriptional regulator [Pseudomonas extremorientalis]WLG54212.1 GntR family transcriptional regulator [Pseudomonas extremorientalis]
MTAHALHYDPILPTLRLVAGKKPSVDDIYPRLFDAILEQRIAPASRFTEEGLGETFGVSRSVIRRVLAKLSHQQVIILRPNQRAQVAAPDAQQTREILEARRLTEITVVQLACAQATPAKIRQLRDLITRERECIERDQRGPAIRLSGEFHLQLAKIAGNEPLAQFLNSLVPLTSLAIARYEAQACTYCAWQEHGAIADAIEQQDVTRAVNLMTLHLNHLERQLNQ